MAEKTRSQGSTGSGSPPAMATQPPGGPTRGVSPGTLPKSPVPPSRGSTGGRPREDGLPPGSPEAQAADKEAERLRVQKRRQAAAALAEPPTLPSAGATVDRQITPTPGVVAPVQTASPVVPEIPWEGKDLREYIDEALAGSEEARVEGRKLQALAAGFSDASVKQFAADAHYPGSSKRMIGCASANGLARLFNKFSLSRVNGEIGLAGMALLLLFTHNRRSDARFKRAIAEMQKKNQPPKSPEVKS